MGDEEEAPPAVEGEGEAAAEEATGEKAPSKTGSISASTGSKNAAAADGGAEGGAEGGGEGEEGPSHSIICLEDIINLQVVTAIIAAEILHFCWYSDFFPWGSWHTRSFTTALASDLIVAILLGLITSTYVPVTNHRTSANLSLALSMLYMALEGTHTVWYPRNLAVFSLHGLHKFLLLFTMTTAMMYVRNVVEESEFPESNCFGGDGGSSQEPAITAAQEGGETEAAAAEGEAAAEGAPEGETAPAEGGEGEQPAEGGGEEAPAEAPADE